MQHRRKIQRSAPPMLVERAILSLELYALRAWAKSVNLLPRLNLRWTAAPARPRQANTGLREPRLAEAPAKRRSKAGLIQGGRLVQGCRLIHLPGRQHPCLEMVRHMAVEEPGSRIVCDHVGGGHAGGQQLNNIRTPVLVEERLAMPVWRVQVQLIAHPQQVPSYFVSVIRLQPA